MRRLKPSVASSLPGNGFMAGKLSVTRGGTETEAVDLHNYQLFDMHLTRNTE